MLENKLGITDSTELARMEERISKQKALEMFESGFFETLEPGTYKSLAISINVFLMRFMILPVNYERLIFQKEILDLLR